MGRLRALVASVVIAALAGCGPVTYIGNVTRTASDDVEAARAVQADILAPYWFTLAVEYLRKAREEAAEADFQAANRLGAKASQAARKAREVAVRRATGAPEPSARGEVGR
jgi:hypothetical protein